MILNLVKLDYIRNKLSATSIGWRINRSHPIERNPRNSTERRYSLGPVRKRATNERHGRSISLSGRWASRSKLGNKHQFQGRRFVCDPRPAGSAKLRKKRCAAPFDPIRPAPSTQTEKPSHQQRGGERWIRKAALLVSKPGLFFTLFIMIDLVPNHR